MNKKSRGIAVMLAALLPILGSGADIVPAVDKVVATGETLVLPRVITINGSESKEAAKILGFRGMNAEIQPDGEGVLTATVDPRLAAESYRLSITPGGVVLVGSDRAGIFYGLETLGQIIEQSEDGVIATCEIEDGPRMAYRGMMIDVVRCYQPIEELLKLVDVASMLKINKLHIHLTDDNGWRIEIPKYPRLTEVGAWRVDREEVFPARANPRADEPATYGGYYTRADMERLVEYAGERCIEVIPEIEMPAHSVAAIASYPELGCPVIGDRFVGVLTGIGGKDAQIIMCAGNDGTLAFVKDVLDEVMDIFPSEYIHLGGDEANKAHWRECPLCNKRIADEGLEDYERLQGWFMDKINHYVRSKGRTAIGWDEVTYGNPEEDMVIMGWQGTGKVAVDYAKRTGRRFVMTPARSTYLIRYQGPQWFEPFTYFGNITLRDAYDFEPSSADWAPEMYEQLWGVQGSMWTEFCRTPQDVQYMMFPRMVAIADVGWRAAGHRDWAGFVRALDRFLPRMEAKGMTYARSMYNVQHTVRPTGDGAVTIAAECIRPDAHIAVNGKEYATPVRVSEPGHYTLVATTDCGEHGEALDLEIDFNRATGRAVKAVDCNNGLAAVLVNGLRGSLRNSDFEWAGWYDRPVSFTVDLGSEQEIGHVVVGVLANANMNAVLPAEISLYTAGEDGNFSLANTVYPDAEKIFSLETRVEDIDLGSTPTPARYVKIEAQNPGHIPDGYPRETNATWIYFDEIQVSK